MTEPKMPAPIYLIGACALAAAAIFTAARPASAPQQPSLIAATTAEAMSPLEIMNSYDKPLPVEEWDAS